jgi:hypothetical protein
MKTIDVPYPFNPLLIGSGRLARHLGFYFTQKNIGHEIWSSPRSLHNLEKTASKHTHFWLLVSDRASLEMARELKLRFPEIPLIHSSAGVEIEDALTLHPLMTFGTELYEISDYEKIPFTVFHEEAKGSEALLNHLFQILPNPRISIPASERTRYHSSCVMASNFSMILWEASLRIHQTSPDLIQRSSLEPILNRTLKNFMTEGINALTGPLARGDTVTVDRHLESLLGHPELDLYQAFKSYYLTELKRSPTHDHRT